MNTNRWAHLGLLRLATAIIAFWIAPFVALQYDNPHLNGLPFAGPGHAGVTYLWRSACVRHGPYTTSLEVPEPARVSK